MVTIVVDNINNRVKYTFDFIFKSRGVDYVLATTIPETTDFLIYSSKYKGDKKIPNATLLNAESILNYSLTKSRFEKEECLAFDGISDPVATIFYILTRFEEYNSNQKDEHGRFPFSESILKKYNWIEKTICDRLAKEICLFVGVHEFEKKEVNIIPTFDIDNTFAYRLKSGRQRFLSISKDILTFNFQRLKERYSVEKGKKDPYDTFEKIKTIAERFPKTIIFWLVGELAEKDRNISIQNLEHRKLIKEMSEICIVNLHPSYASFLSKEKLNQEKLSLEEVVKKKITASRQHFLRFQMPESFRLLEKLGFMDEYSMGFAEHIGFRSGTARSHSWFDLEQNRISDLVIHPFVYMDGTLNEYMQLDVEQSKTKVRELYNEINNFGGDFIFLWHNETIGDYQKWKGWSELLNFTLNLKDE